MENDCEYFCPICEKSKLKKLYKNDFEFNNSLFDGDYSAYKECDKCNLNVCISCVAITSCQTTSCICKNCFDYACEKCGKKISRNVLYLTDEHPKPRCTKCNKKRNKIKN